MYTIYGHEIYSRDEEEYDSISRLYFAKHIETPFNEICDDYVYNTMKEKYDNYCPRI